MNTQLVIAVFLAAAFPTVTALVGILVGRNESKDVRSELRSEMSDVRSQLTGIRERLARVEEKLGIAA